MAAPRREIPELADGSRVLLKLRRVRKGAWVACEITVAAGMVHITEDGGTTAAPIALEALPEQLVGWGMGEPLHPVMRALLFGRAIDETEYRHLLAVAKWAREHAPLHPAAQPDQPINLATIPIDMIF